MKAKRYWIWALFFVCCIPILWVNASGTNSSGSLQPVWDGASSFTGGKPVRPGVILMLMTNDPNGVDLAEKIGPLTKTDLNQQVEKALLKSGIKLDDMPIPSKSPGATLFLFIDVLVNTRTVGNSPLYAAFVNTRVFQYVKLPGSREVIMTSTWPGFPWTVLGRLLLLDSATIEQEIKEEVGREVNRFINDYITVNTSNWENLQKTIKCEKCGQAFEKGAVSGEYEDRCPECGYSKTEDLRTRFDCRANLTAISEGLYKYSLDNDIDELTAGDKWCDLLLQGGYVTEKQLRCPNSQAKRGQSSYAINKNILGKMLGTIPPDVVLAFESKPGWNQFGGPELLTTENHGGKGCNVASIDTGADFVKMGELAQLKWRDD